MKFAFVSNMDGSPWGGSEDLWAGAAERLLRQGHEVHASTVDWGEAEAEPLRRLVAQGLQLHRRPIPRALTVPALVRQRLAWRLGLSRPAPHACDVIAELRPDLTVFSLAGGFPNADLCDPFARRGLPYALAYNCAAEHWWPADEHRRRAAALTEAARAVYFVSDGNRRLVERQLVCAHPHTEIVWNPFRVPYDAAPPWPAAAAPLRLACVGRLDPEAKGCDLALESLARPEWRDRDVTLTFFGTGRAAEGTQLLARRLGIEGRVRFAGHVPDVVGIWRDHHALLLPSRYEGMPLAIVEAMLCGRPCIVTAIAGHAEFVTEGETGFLAAAPTIDAVAGALERAYAARARWREMGAAAARAVRARVPADPAAAFAERMLALAQSR